MANETNTTTPKFKKEILVTPKGTAEPYCYLGKPDYGSEQFKQPRGLYKVALTIPTNESQEMVDKIVAAHKQDYKLRLKEYNENPPRPIKGKKVLEPYVGNLPFTDNGDGTTTFSFKSYASYIDKKGEQKDIILPIVDKRGKLIQGERPAISGGSILRLKYSIFPYGWSHVAGASVKLVLEAVMLIKLVEYSAAAAAEQGWGDLEDDDDEYGEGTPATAVDTDDDDEDF